jgi:ribosomal silencing factor RsfS
LSLGGKSGVFDLEDILQILRDERLRDICVIEIPPEQQYARYLILATTFSARHLKSTSEYINKLVRNKF